MADTPSDVRHHLQYGIANAPIRPYPFPHFYLEDAFPDEFYAAILGHLPDTEIYRSIAETGRVDREAEKGGRTDLFQDRYTITMGTMGGAAAIEAFEPGDGAFWREFLGWLTDEPFCDLVLQKFDPYLRQRFQDTPDGVRFGTDVQLIRDFTNYSLGPHTDHRAKVVVLLFYLAATRDRPDLGTSIYVPNDPNFRCEGGPHYAAKTFTQVATMAYRPNAMMGFLKTSNSFHGVEPVSGADTRRDLIQFSIVEEGAR